MFRPSFWTRLRSYFWPVTIEKRKGRLDHELEVLVYHGKLMLDTTEVNYSFGKLHDVMRSVLGKLKERRYPFDQVLILGYGGGVSSHLTQIFNCGCAGTRQELHLPRKVAAV